jgi:hypothetical protein
MPAQQSLQVSALTTGHRHQLGDDLASPDDREVLTAVLDGIE